MYSLADYGHMIADRVRMDTYAYALKDVIGPETVVMDIGTATGIHAILAAKFGARKVYAVESNEAIRLAQELAAANGFSHIIEFIEGMSTDITLPEKADVIVSDLRGTLPLYGGHIQALVDARQRHLVAGGRLIPVRDTLWAAVVEAKSLYRDLVGPWDYPYGINMDSARDIVLNSWSGDGTDEIRSRDLLMEPQIWATLDYMSIVNPSILQSKLRGRAARDGVAHGILVWFDAEIGPGRSFSNGPQERMRHIATVYGRGFFPLQEPVNISEGDIISLTISAEHRDGDYDWTWETSVSNSFEKDRTVAKFKQSTLLGVE